MKSWQFHDVGAVVYFLRKVIWMVPGFTVDAYRDRLGELHGLITEEVRSSPTRHAS